MFYYGNQTNQSKTMRFLIVAILFMCVNAVRSSSKLAPTVRLNSGYEIPVLGLGTYPAKKTECVRAVKDAIDVGYRHIDSAFVYGNEKEVGIAVRAKITEGVIKRGDIFITTKLWNTFHEPEQVRRAFQKSFENLNLTYIDLYLLHTPIAFRIVNKDGSTTPPTDIDDVSLFPLREENGKWDTIDVDYLDTWRAMEELVKDGRVRSIGVSNFNSQQIDRLLSVATIKPVTNQVECHPNLNQHKLLKFCTERNVTLTAYSPLGRPHTGGSNLALNNPKVHEIAVSHNKTSAQVVLRYTYQSGAIVIPKSTKKERIQENIDIFDFELNENDMATISGLNTNNRLLTFDQADHDKNYPFNIEF